MNSWGVQNIIEIQVYLVSCNQIYFVWVRPRVIRWTIRLDETPVPRKDLLPCESVNCATRSNLLQTQREPLAQRPYKLWRPKSQPWGVFRSMQRWSLCWLVAKSHWQDQYIDTISGFCMQPGMPSILLRACQVACRSQIQGKLASKWKRKWKRIVWSKILIWSWQILKEFWKTDSILT